MAQAYSQISSSSRRRCLLIFILSVVLGAVLAEAQQQPYLVVQGPTRRASYRFEVGEQIELRLVGEEETFTARINQLFPESQTVRLDDYILSLSSIASMKFKRKGAGLRGYLIGQGGANLVIIGLVSVAGGLEPGQGNFAKIAAGVNGAMVVAGLIGRNKRVNFQQDTRYVLRVAGGDLRKHDDVERG